MDIVLYYAILGRSDREKSCERLLGGNLSVPRVPRLLLTLGAPRCNVVRTNRRSDIAANRGTVSRVWRKNEQADQRLVMLYLRQGRGGGYHWFPIVLRRLPVPAQQFTVQCANTTGKPLAVRISADECYIQQYLLRPKGKPGDTVTCHGTGSRSMMFHLVSGKSTGLLLMFSDLLTVDDTL